jgi:chromosome segregation ATPase
MAAQVLFNHLAYVDRLTRGGFTPEQARASAEALDTAFSEGVATRSDVETSKHELQSSIEALKHELQSSVEILRHETASSNDALRHESASSIEGVKHEISLLKHDMGALQREVGESESRLRIEFKRDISESEARVRLEIAQSKNETLRWLFGFVIVLIGAIFTIVKFVR